MSDVVAEYRLLEVPGWMSDEELRHLHERARTTAGRIVEVGCYLGRTSCAILAALKDGSRLTCVDTWDGRGTSADPPQNQMELFYQHIGERKLPMPRVFGCDSVTGAGMYAAGSADWIFIDASHDYESVKADIAAWLPKLRKGGLISGHDYGTDWPGVTRAVAEAFGHVERPVGSIWEVRL